MEPLAELQAVDAGDVACNPFDIDEAISHLEAARKFFEAQPPSYRKVIGWWIVSAKKEETRQKRLQKLIAASARGKRL